jgi:hypothetical protein
MPSAADAPFETLRAVRMTCAPFSAKARAVSAPRPLVRPGDQRQLPLQVDARKDLGCCRFMIESRWQAFPLSGPDWNLT